MTSNNSPKKAQKSEPNPYSISDWLKNPDYKKELLPLQKCRVLPRRGASFQPPHGGHGLNDRHEDAWEHLKSGRTFTMYGLGKRYRVDALSARTIALSLCKHKGVMLEAVGIEEAKGRRGAKPVVYRFTKES